MVRLRWQVSEFTSLGVLVASVDKLGLGWGEQEEALPPPAAGHCASPQPHAPLTAEGFQAPVPAVLQARGLTPAQEAGAGSGVPGRRRR